jgi:SpoVK/Ycf46/Vps4 family AAA+-type ATPase
VFDLPGLPIEEVNERIEKFWAQADVYESFNFVHKTGIIFHGPAGNGKTCVITSLVKRLLAKGGIVITVSEFSQASQALRVIRQVEPKRRIMTLIEDMDTLLGGENKQQEQFALSMLDGQDQVSGVVHIATTNYPEQLADRFIKRPGRFDLVIGMDVPSEITRRGYFQKILRDDAHPKLDYLVSKTEGMALAHLREIASSYLCLGIPVDETVARLRTGVNMAFKPTKAYGKVEGLGFSVGCIKTVDEMEGK